MRGSDCGSDTGVLWTLGGGASCFFVREVQIAGSSRRMIVVSDMYRLRTIHIRFKGLASVDDSISAAEYVAQPAEGVAIPTRMHAA